MVVHRGTISIAQGGDLAEMSGITTAAVLPGVSFGQTEVVVTDGSLDLEGLGSGATSCAGIAGVQLLLRLDPIPAAPGLGVTGTVVLAALLLGVGVWAGTRSRRA